MKFLLQLNFSENILKAEMRKVFFSKKKAALHLFNAKRLQVVWMKQS
jgi:hypothetical protein